MNKFIIFQFIFAIVIQFCFTLDVDEEWQKFKADFKKVYKNAEDEKAHKEAFILDLKDVQEHNERFAQGKETYKKGLNQFSDILEDEFEKFAVTEMPEDPKLYKIHSKNVTLRGPLPLYVNWVQRGFNIPVQNQKSCGSCYAFSSVAAIEAQYFIKYRSNIKASEQDVVDCSTPFGNFGCKGGWSSRVFDYSKKKGITLERNDPYLAKARNCTSESKWQQRLQVDKYFRVRYGDEEELKKIVATVGPVTLAMDASHKSFMRYRGGIYYEPNCSSHKFTHGMLIVGYGTTDGQDYWIIKNSWGERWGEKGYMRLARNKDNHCGIASHPIYPVGVKRIYM